MLPLPSRGGSRTSGRGAAYGRWGGGGSCDTTRRAGKRHDVPAHHRAAEALDAYIEGGGLEDGRPGGAVSERGRAGERLTGRALTRRVVLAMIHGIPLERGDARACVVDPLGTRVAQRRRSSTTARRTTVTIERIVADGRNHVALDILAPITQRSGLALVGRQKGRVLPPPPRG